MEKLHRSARTCIRQVPAVFKLVYWQPHTRNLDIGGGRFQDATEYLSKRHVSNVVYDPYNRLPAHNKKALDQFDYHTVTLCNVLNVLEKSSDITKVLLLAKMYVKVGGCIYISVHEGNRSGKSCIGMTGTWQANKKLPLYMKWILPMFAGSHIEKLYKKGSGFNYLCITR